VAPAASLRSSAAPSAGNTAYDSMSAGDGHLGTLVQVGQLVQGHRSTIIAT